MLNELKYSLIKKKEIPYDLNLDEIYNKFNFDYFRIVDDYVFNFFLGTFFLKKKNLVDGLYFLNKSILNNENDYFLIEKCNFILEKIKINKFNFIVKNTDNFIKETIENVIPFSKKIYVLNDKNISLNIKCKNIEFVKINSKNDFLKFVDTTQKPVILINSGYCINKSSMLKLISGNYRDNYSFLNNNKDNLNTSYYKSTFRELALINREDKNFINENFHIEKVYSEIDIILDISSELIKENYFSEEIINYCLSKVNFNINSFSLYYFFYNCVNYFLRKNDLFKAKQLILQILNVFNCDDVFYEILFNISIKESNFLFAKEICKSYLKENPRDIKFIDLLFFAHQNIKHDIFYQDKELLDGISVCIIVKNEEVYISECINSVKEIANEIIVLDTGSTDNTITLAKESGANVFYYLWDNNFANARNKSIEYAKYKWIFILDSDEVLLNPKEAKKELEKYLNDKDVLCIDVTRIEKVDNSKFRLTRIFRKHKKIYFEGSIHEQINHIINDILEKCNMKTVYSDLKILHYGYLSEVMERKKTNNRNLYMLENAINKNIDPKETIFYYKIKYLCNLIELESKNKLEYESKFNKIDELTKEIFLEYKKAKIIKDIDLFIPTIQFAETVFLRMLKLNKNYEALKFNSFFVKYFTNSITINYNQSLALYKNNKFFEALLYAKKAFYLYITDRFDKSSIYNEDIGKKHCPYIIALIYEVLEYYELAKYWFECILLNLPNFEEAKEGLKRIENKKNKHDLLSVGILCGKNFKITEKNILNLKDYAEEMILFDKYLILENSLLAKKYNIKYFPCISYEKVEILLNFNKTILIDETSNKKH
ncbi:MAG: hypothetical protein KatS3mg068_0325 [Candidatus Sericytochromatia bacterium]|nr:MAG: hypothetical protein KatS3mg068_0325 [Candidatus Sericytochromatia bacterium]